MLESSTDTWSILNRFCQAEPFRSATVDELLLDDDFVRRPLRPEDLAFVDFSTPVSDATFDALSSLMAQRILLSVNEAEEPRLPATADSAPAWRAFYASREDGRALVAALEAHAFGFLVPSRRTETIGAAVARRFDAALDYWRGQQALLEAAGYAGPGLGFLLIQHVPLYASVEATARLIPPEVAAAFAGDACAATQETLERLMREQGLRTGRHSYWQFYLPGSLAAVNLLHRLARSPLSVGGYAGARLVFEAERAALCRRFQAGGDESAAAVLAARAERIEALLADRLGAEAATEVSAGAALMEALLARSRAGLSAQLGWLRDIGWAERAARNISERIAREVPDIYRDTFVEPREMCSTTHVHDEHRLVVIETGHMRFWGNVGMAHDMGPGDMILVPKGRLHGSTVLSESCTYHQPIIPDDWQETIPDPHPATLADAGLESAVHRG